MLFRFIFALALLSTNHTKLFANDFENGIRAFEEKKDEEAFEYFKRSYFENPFNKITCAYLQNIQKILKFNPNQHGLPDNLLEDSFYDSFDFLGKYIDTSFIKPALTYRKMQEIEEQLLTSINLPIQKSNKIKKLNTTKAHLQKEMIDLCNNQSRQALKLLIKDFKKNRDTYSTKRARNTQDLQKFFLELSKKYCVAINLDNLLFIYGQDLNVLLNEGIENILNILYYFLFSVGDLEAFEHFATMDATHITSLFKYIELNKPNSKKSNIILRILAQFYNSIKDNEDKNYLLSIVAQRHKELVKKTKKDPFETYFLLDNLIFKYLAAIGNTQVIESLTKNFFLEGTQKRKMALYFSKLGELQNNYTCSLILAKILEERNNVHDIKMSKEIYMKLLKNSSDDEQKICLISLIIEIFRNYGISDLKSPLITESYREECNWLHKNAEELNHPDLPHILLILSLIGNAYALQNEDMTHQKENYERAIASYAIDSNLSALITICQMLIADNGSALTNSKTKINYYEQFIENTSKFDPVLRENSSEILEFVYPKLGFCYYHESQYNCAAYYFKKSIEGADFYSIPAYVNICIVYLKNYNKEELKKLLEKALSLRSEDGICFFLLGLLEINDSNFEDAFFYFEKAQKNGIKSANLYLNFFKHFDKYGKIHNSTSIAQEDNSQNENDAITELGNLQDDFSSNNEEHIILKSSVNLQAVETNDTPNSPSLDNKDQDEEDEIFDSEETNLRPWEKYADKQKKPALKKGESKIALEKTSIEAENSKLKKLQELVEKLQTKKLKKNKMKKYLSALLKLTPELAINRGEGVRTKFEFRNMVMPMHMQHNSAGNLVEGGRLKAIQNFVSNVVASTSTSPSN